MSAKGLAALQERVGHQFADQSLLKRALTHSSLAATSRVGDLERLEFLGDRVLGLLTADALWRKYPKMKEGELAPRLNALVRKETCAKAALHYGLDKLIRMSAQEQDSGGRAKKAILGDVCEAFLGALYVDGGLDAARKAYDLFWTPNFEALARRHRDAKTTLQEWSQERGLGPPKYEIATFEGPAHAPAFTIEVLVKGYEPTRGFGASKRAAQMEAASAFLVREKIWLGDE
jgi:ribonuclease-3